MTSRFREELAARGRTARTGVAEAVQATVATAGRAVFFSGLTVLLGLLGLVLFEFMILRSVGIAGAIVVGLAVARGADAAAGGPGDPRARGSTASRVRRVGRRAGDRTARGPGSPAGSCAARSAVLVPTLALLLAARLAVPARPVQRAGRHDPAGRACRRAPPSTGSPTSSARASSRRSSLAVRTDGPATAPDNLAALYDYSRRLAADPRVTRVDEPRRRRPAARPSTSTSSSTATRTARRTASSQTALAATTRGDLTAFTRLHAVRPEPRRGAGRSSRDLRDPTGPLAPPAGVDRPRRRRRGRRGRRRRPGRAPTSRGPRCSSSSRPTSSCSCCCARSSCRPRRWS